MDGGSIPPSSTITYALTREYVKKRAGQKPPALRAQHRRSTALRRLRRRVVFYRISTVRIITVAPSGGESHSRTLQRLLRPAPPRWVLLRGAHRRVHHCLSGEELHQFDSTPEGVVDVQPADSVQAIHTGPTACLVDKPPGGVSRSSAPRPAARRLSSSLSATAQRSRWHWTGRYRRERPRSLGSLLGSCGGPSRLAAGRAKDRAAPPYGQPCAGRYQLGVGHDEPGAGKSVAHCRRGRRGHQFVARHHPCR